MDIQGKLTGLAMMGATWVMWLLILISVFGFAIALERAIVMLLTRDNIRRLKDDVLGFLRRGDIEGAKKRLARSRSIEARVAAAGLEIDDGAESAAERMAATAQTAKLGLERRLGFLGTVGANAPFVGLLGTVIGIINAFHELNNAAGKVSAGLMAEVGEALVATAVGILVAIPAVVFFNIFNRVIKSRISRADALSREVLAYLKSGPRAVAPQGQE
jgi:biopolymer transport protein ExbB